MVEILDPRLKRLDLLTGEVAKKPALDQLPTYEVFVQSRESRPFKHEGCVHANSLSMALVFAKEQFSRRGMCTGIWVVDTRDVVVTEYSDNNFDIYDQFDGKADCGGVEYCLFHMTKRGTQHSFAGTVEATSPQEALTCAKVAFVRKKPVLNVWLAKTNKFLKTTEEDKKMWETTPEKLFREAIDYKTQKKLDEFKNKQQK